MVCVVMVCVVMVCVGMVCVVSAARSDGSETVST